MPQEILPCFLFLPELKFLGGGYDRRGANFHVEKKSAFEVCPKCATPSHSTYDHRTIQVKDSPVRGRAVYLHVRKRRLWCKSCRKPFTEPVPGVRKGSRTTERYKASVLWACENFSDLKSVRRAYRCSSSFLYKALYEQLELKRRTRLYPWPKVVGIDEHSFQKGHRYVSVFIDYSNRRMFEVVEGKSGPELTAGLAHTSGRENVRVAIIDLADSFKSFIAGYFPNAEIIADKFHVLRLLSPALNKRRIQLTGDRRTLRLRRWLLRNGKSLSFEERSELYRWLAQDPTLHELYQWKERLHGFYRIRGEKRAERALTAMTDMMAKSGLPEIQRLRRTLMKWRKPILAYFKYGYTNGRTEGFNNKAKLVKRRAYGYRSFENYRLRLLNACA